MVPVFTRCIPLEMVKVSPEWIVRELTVHVLKLSQVPKIAIQEGPPDIVPETAYEFCGKNPIREIIVTANIAIIPNVECFIPKSNPCI